MGSSMRAVLAVWCWGSARRGPGPTRLRGRALPADAVDDLTWKLTVGAAVFTSLYYLFAITCVEEPALRELLRGTDPARSSRKWPASCGARPGCCCYVLRGCSGCFWPCRHGDDKAAVGSGSRCPSVCVPVSTCCSKPVMPSVRLTHWSRRFPTIPFGWFAAWLFARPRKGCRPASSGTGA